MRERFSTRQIVGIIAPLVLGVLACLVVIGGSLQQASAGAPAGLSGVAPGTKISSTVLDDTANGKSTSFIVLLSEQADLSQAYSMKDQDARGWYVYNTLKAVADRTQAPLRAYLDAQYAQYQSHWAANMLVVYGNRSLVDSLAARPDVKVIESNRSALGIEPPSIASLVPADASPNAIEWGVQNVNAPQVWMMGYTGQGVVIANQDTGMRWTHAAIKPHYRGWDGAIADHNYNWHDSIHTGGGVCGANSMVPCDDHGHGTHTTGTTSGDDGSGNQIGVAPGAKWMGCRNMDQGNGTPATYTECFEFFMAPTDLNGNNPDPTLRPHVMNNSWGCPPSEGCAANTLQTEVENTEASGIFVEVSAGNSGPNCSTVSDPPAIYAASFSTGAININNVLASFSSRGPVTVDGSNRMKPNISAPGSNVRSSYNSGDTSYANLSGTSMAGPHVVGVVALLWSAHPELSRDIATTKTILQNTANPGVTVSPAQTCGGIPSSQIPNNSFGYGRVDALAAVNSVPFVTATPSVTTVAGTSTVAATATNPVATSTTGATAQPSNTSILPTVTLIASTTATVAQPSSTTGAVTASATSANTAIATTTLQPTTGATETIGVATGTAEATATVCTVEFTDVPPGSPFYDFIRCLACRGIISGYPDGTFRPNNYVSRGQISKMVSQAAHLTDDPGDQVFEDVPPGSPFYDFINRLFHLGVMGGYPCGTTPDEPCIPPDNRPYFRPNNPASRGQISKIVSNTAGYSDTFADQTFQDVDSTSPFYQWIMRLASRGIITGYPCGLEPTEPCIPPDNLPYFRPNKTVTRGQASKIVANTFFPGCSTPLNR